MNYRMVIYTLGLVMLFESAFFLVPIVTALVYSEWLQLFAFLATLLICAAIGAAASFKKPKKMKLYTKEGFIIVSLSWVLLSIFGAIPFVIDGSVPNYIDAFFETVSGFTTTGSSIVADVEALPRSMLIWRSFTHWVGGMGVLVFVMAVLPLSGAQNMHIMKAESPGPQVSKLVPRVRKTALILYVIYFCLTLVQFILLVFDMPVFDAICTAFGTAGTGGFGIKSDSMLSYSSYVQVVCTIFMLIFSINFNSYYLVLKGKIKDALSSEVKLFLVIVFAAIAVMTVSLYTSDKYEFESVFDCLKHVSFTVASIISTTGFSTLDFNTWPVICTTVLVLIMFIGACAGSTGGGIKVSRIILLGKGLSREMRMLIHPKQIRTVTVDRSPIGDGVLRSVSTYMTAYVIIFVASMLALSFDPYVAELNASSFTGTAFVTNFSAVTATINNIGPGLELCGPYENFAFFSPISKLILSFDMLAGRLEIFPMLLLFNRGTWKK